MVFSLALSTPVHAKIYTTEASYIILKFKTLKNVETANEQEAICYSSIEEGSMNF